MNLPNLVTLSRIVLVPVFTYTCLAYPPGRNLLAAFVFLVASLTDLVDGHLARSRKEITRFGQLIDPIADKLLITAALLALIQLGEVSTWAALIILAREFSVSGLRMLASVDGQVIAASRWGKLKTITQIVAIMGFLLGISWAPWLMWVAVMMTILSGVDYFRKAQDVLKSSM
ncbi:MAG: CDP-diacylglycerol--glycerol-3-phosphate 3-phosphatidyltransferase [Bacillota bacterium]|nr:CDP-diacylglycerol--glycerol-3-phosphate 3-phosphatidyltransferase [Bacillota bacterium]HHT90298.1 CDP-diacylglycerol--glycerol-3-phosphate 3-phosphatidyltransferase [Bacillota bacterium]